MRTAYAPPADDLDARTDRALRNDLPALSRAEGALADLRRLCRDLVAKRRGLYVDPIARVLTKDGKQLPTIMPAHPDPRDAPLDTEGTRIANLSAHLSRIEDMLQAGVAAVSGILSEAGRAAETAMRLDAAGWPGGLCRDCDRWQPPGDGSPGYCQGGDHPARADETCEFWQGCEPR